MGSNVYANGREIACKASDGKSICSFPDVCLSPPSPPAGPVPLPYPNTGMASDMTDGSKSVQIGGKEVMLKDSSYFSKSTGDEAATKSFGAGVVTHQIQGKVFFTSWSFDVLVEGENAVRHLDLTTHNHGSQPPNTPPWPFMASMKVSKSGATKDSCAEDKKKEQDACSKHEVKTKTGKINKSATKAAQCKSKECQKARKCKLTPYKPNQCCPGQTGHHLIEVHGLCHPGKPRGRPLPQFKKYDQNKAPVVCAACKKGSRYDKEHGRLHAVQGTAELDAMAKPPGTWTYKDAREAASMAHSYTFPKSGCNEQCIKDQLDQYHESIGVKDSDTLRTETPPMQDWQKTAGRQAVDAAKQKALNPNGGVA